jgi:hypothetical protein
MEKKGRVGIEEQGRGGRRKESEESWEGKEEGEQD